jgi:hypothetical protein
LSGGNGATAKVTVKKTAAPAAAEKPAKVKKAATKKTAATEKK